MTEPIIYILGIFTIVMIFSLGFITGHRRAANKPLMPVAPEEEESAYGCDLTPDDLQRIAANEKAFQACMNYSMEEAYRIGEAK